MSSGSIDGIDSSGRRGSSRIGSIGGILSSTWNNCDGIDECATWVKKEEEKREKKEVNIVNWLNNVNERKKGKEREGERGKKEKKSEEMRGRREKG